MAALVEGQQYGLSSQGNYSNNKTLIFVKLTDSALKAIEEYLKPRTPPSLQPVIQFQANRGVITVPKPMSPNGRQSFGFTLSSVETDAPQGSFEYLQQCGSRSLESLGCMLYKMHINASEDSYEKTREKMDLANKEIKKNCTKVLKSATGPYAGRKVKVKRPIAPIPPLPPKISNSPPYSAVMNKPISKPQPVVNNSSSHVSNYNTYNNNSSSAGSKHMHSNSKSLPDIMKQSYRDRIIHLLAVRPYKKPELLARLMKDGIREKDKKGLSAILCHVAILKENTYSLGRHSWNEVREDWPFYSSEELELIKRRRPPNLTPPSENGNHSPSSTQPNISPIQKRGPFDFEAQPSKKQRISHYNRIENPVAPNGTGISLKTDNSILLPGKLDSNGLSQNKREITLNGHSKSNWNGNSALDCNSQKSPLAPLQSFTDNSLSKYGNFVKEESSRGTRVDSTLRPADSSYNSNVTQVSPDSNTHLQALPAKHETYNEKHLNGEYGCDRYSQRINNGFEDGIIKCPKVTSTTNGSGSFHSSPNSSPESGSSMDYNVSNGGNTSPTQSETPSYIKEYHRITNNEQRAKYKADFNAEYQEYCKLHSIINEVSQKFANLESDLRNSVHGSDKWLETKNQIVSAYQESKKDDKYQYTRRKFQYLHEKLSHIKNLVMTYDKAQAVNQAPSGKS